MESNASSSRAKRVGTGLCFIVFPLVFVFAFSVHPAGERRLAVQHLIE